jgi:hypothetical protein
MCVYPTWCHHKATGVYHAPRFTAHVTHGNDASVKHRNIACIGGLARAVNNLSVTNEQIVQRSVLRYLLIFFLSNRLLDCPRG